MAVLRTDTRSLNSKGAGFFRWFSDVKELIRRALLDDPVPYA